MVISSNPCIKVISRQINPLFTILYQFPVLNGWNITPANFSGCPKLSEINQTNRELSSVFFGKIISHIPCKKRRIHFIRSSGDLYLDTVFGCYISITPWSCAGFSSPDIGASGWRSRSSKTRTAAPAAWQGSLDKWKDWIKLGVLSSIIESCLFLVEFVFQIHYWFHLAGTFLRAASEGLRTSMDLVRIYIARSGPGIWNLKHQIIWEEFASPKPVRFYFCPQM